MSLAMLRRCVAFSVILTLALLRIAAGETSGDLSGRAADAVSGMPIAGVKITAVSPSSTYRTTTNTAGYYSLIGIFPDTYALTATATGYEVNTSAGHVVNPDQSVTVDFVLLAHVRTLGTVMAKQATGLVESGVTADRYVLNARQAELTSGATGSYGLYTVTGALSTQPGVTTDPFTFPHVRGGRGSELTYEYDGLTTTQPVTNDFATDRVDVGLTRMEVETGGYSPQGGSSISGVVNVVVDRGTYPAHGSITALLQSPTYYHGLKLDYGAATRDQRFSYYLAGIWWNADYDWGSRTATYPTAFAPGIESPPYIATPGSISPSADEVVNLFYRFGTDERDEAQLLASSGFQHYEYKVRPLYFPSLNPSDGAAPMSNTPVNGFCDNGIGLFPGQSGCLQAIGKAHDRIDFGSSIGKIRLTHDFSPSSSVTLRYARIDTNDISWVPFGLEKSADYWLQGTVDQRIGSVEYASEVDQSNLVRAGYGRNVSSNIVYLTFPSGGLSVNYLSPTVQTWAFAQDRYRHARLTADGGVRYDLNSYYPVYQPAFSKHDLEPRVAVAYAIGLSTVVRASYGFFEQMPSTNQVEAILTNLPNYTDITPTNWFTAQGAIPPLPPIEANPDAATSHAFEASLEQALGSGWALKVTPFWRSTSNLIVDFPGRPVVSGKVSAQNLIPQSVGPYFTSGVESEIQLPPQRALTGFITYTHTRTLSAVASDSEQPLTQGARAIHLLVPTDFIPEDVASVVLDYRYGRWEFNPELSYLGGYRYGVGRAIACLGPEPLTNPCAKAPAGGVTFQPNPSFYDDQGNPIDTTEGRDPNSLHSPSHMLVNLGIFYNLSPRSQAGVRVFNLLQDYGPLSFSKNSHFTHPGDPANGIGAGGLDYGQSPYAASAFDTSRVFLFSLSSKI